MEILENENEKVNRICEILRKETLEPAEVKAKSLIEEAKRKADEIIRHAETEAHKILEMGKMASEQEKKILQASLAQGVKQALESLRQEIEELFRLSLEKLIVKSTQGSETVAKMIEVLLGAVQKEGISANLKAHVPKGTELRELSSLIAADVLGQLEENPIEIGNFNGGVQLELVDKKMRLDMSDRAIQELLAPFVREDIRKFIFGL